MKKLLGNNVEKLMRVTERLALAEHIASELQRRYTFADLDRFLNAFGIHTRNLEWGNSKRVYARDILSGESEKLLRAMAEELKWMSRPDQAES